MSSLFALSRKDLAIATLLTLVMLLTRSHHFGSAFSPPDASLAVFFLAGMWIASQRGSSIVFGGLLIVAALADQMAFAATVSDWCVTAAYGFLIPAYGAMWYGGRLCREASIAKANGFARIAVAVVIGSAVYFAISNLSFFFFSGYFDSMALTEYVARTIKYFPWYLGWASVYIGGALAIALLIGVLKRDDAAAATR